METISNESLHDAAKRLFPDKSTLGWKDSYYYDSRLRFMEGANWQKEKDKYILEALRDYENAFQRLLTTKLGKANEESLKIWFSICSSNAKKLLKSIK